MSTRADGTVRRVDGSDPTHRRLGIWAGLSLDRPRIMGVVNVTPDSFSDGGRYGDIDDAVSHGRALAAAGADIIDIGGESTRPGAAPVDPEEECRRVLPVIRGLARHGLLISIDTRHAPVMAAALKAGAGIINDVSALQGPGALALAVDTAVPVILMHMRGDPQTMQTAPHYDDVVLDVTTFLAGRALAAEAAGVRPERIAIDPGIGFGKTHDHNLALMRALPRFTSLGYPLMIGVSRKALIGRLSGVEAPADRLAGSLSAAIWAVEAGANLVRVHDVRETVEALRVFRALASGRSWD